MSGFSGTESWRFRPDIEGLRAVAILGVILFHAGISGVPGGFLGVDVFFVLSGFLITGILLEEVRKTGTISLPAFWARRARRLLPAATLVSLVTLVVLVRLDSPFAEQRYAGSAISFATYWSNLLFWRRGTDYFDHTVGTDPFLHTWSLAVEEQYYLLFAPCVLFLALVSRRKGTPCFQRRLLLIAVAVSLVSLFGYLLLAGSRPVIAFYSLPTRAWEFGIGSVLALAAARAPRVGQRSDQAVAILALLGVVAAWFVGNQRTPLSGLVTVLPVLGTAALVHVGPGGSTLVGGLLQAAPMRWLGRLSYSWYLWHWPITVYWSKLIPGNPIPLALGMPVLSLGLAQLTYIMVEHPARRALWLQPARRGLLAALLLATVTCVTALGTRWRSGQRLLAPEYAFILRARDARTKIHRDGCDREPVGASMERCIYGAPGADSTVVLFGDSHAAQWFPALEPLAIQRGWRLVPLTQPGCPSLSLEVWSSMPNRTPATCARWREAALERIRTLRPFLIVISNYRWHSLLDPLGNGAHQSAALRPDLWEQGLRRTLDQLPAASAILLLEDSPVPRIDVPTCLVEHLHEVGRCAFPRDAGTAPEISRVERAISRTDPRVSYGDLADAVCDGPICPAVRGPTAVYGDDNHLSVEFAASLAPRMRAILDAVVAARPFRSSGTSGGPR